LRCFCEQQLEAKVDRTEVDSLIQRMMKPIIAKYEQQIYSMQQWQVAGTPSLLFRKQRTTSSNYSESSFN
jgi:hypothetical protein